MTVSELGRRLKSASPMEIEELAEAVPAKELLEPLLCLLLRESRRGLLFLLFVEIFIAFLGTCASGWGDNFFSNRPITGSIVEILVRKFSWGKFLVAATLLSIFPIVQSRVMAYSLTASRHSAAVLLATIARKLPVEEIGWLCAKLWIYRRAVALHEWQVIEEAVTVSLLHRDGVEAPALSEETLCWLRWRLAKTESPEFRVAALLTLAEAGDGKIASIAQNLQSDADERVRAAASEALKIVEASGSTIEKYASATESFDGTIEPLGKAMERLDKTIER
jgi:hypothetical protein